MRNYLITATLALLPAAAALAQSDVDADSKYAWGENIGWTNWRDAGEPDGAEGVQVHDSFLSGFVWGENVGWINFGDGLPADGVAYANATGVDFGVNRDAASGELSGLAWGENIGWINFAGGAQAAARTAARLVSDGGTCRLRGYVWGENVGWINFDDDTHFVAAPGTCGDPCEPPGDLDQDGDVDLSDLAIMLSNFGVPSGAAPDDGDLDGDQAVSLADLAILLSNFGTTCP